VTKDLGKLTVSGLVALLQEVVETNFITVTVEGEVSNFAAPASGHWYFTLKDNGAQLRSVMFRTRNRFVECPPRNGLQVICSGTVTVYVARGEMQLVVDSMAQGGQGQLQAAFETLKAKLEAEGLFNLDRKRPLPSSPHAIGIVTSATGAAIHDILNILKRRAPDIHLLLRPVKVQGYGAAEEIAAAIDDLNRYGSLDVLIVGRGGGSLEDLWAFNEEVVARAIVRSAVPVISAVGHETDFTIADFVSDLRAPTPSAAAELVAKNRQEIEVHIDHLIMRLRSRIDQSLKLIIERFSSLERRLKLAAQDFSGLPDNISGLEHRLCLAMRALMSEYSNRLGLAVGRLDALSPLLQLDRGYVIASRDQDSPGLVSTKDLKPGDLLWLRFAHGQVRCRVEKVDS
jgi:exodeoxyribonuclease VII large subunit